jgi:hypothetical protein
MTMSGVWRPGSCGSLWFEDWRAQAPGVTGRLHPARTSCKRAAPQVITIKWSEWSLGKGLSDAERLRLRQQRLQHLLKRDAALLARDQAKAATLARGRLQGLCLGLVSLVCVQGMCSGPAQGALLSGRQRAAWAACRQASVRAGGPGCCAPVQAACSHKGVLVGCKCAAMPALGPVRPPGALQASVSARVCAARRAGRGRHAHPAALEEEEADCRAGRASA